MVLSDVALDFMLGALLRLISCTRQLVRNRGYHRAIDASGDVVADIENVAGLQGCSLGHFLRVAAIAAIMAPLTENERKTLGLLRDLQGARSVGVIAEQPELGIVEIARPAGVVAAITPSTNPAATPANKIINALKGRNAIIVAPSPKGWSTCELLLEFIHAQLKNVKAPDDLVQMLPAPVTKESTRELMRQADLVVATGSQANVRAAYSSGTPAVGVGLGNVAVIVDHTAELADAARKIAESKCFDNATSCSSRSSA